MKWTTKILIVACVLGLSLLLYPSFSNYWNEKNATSSINTYKNELNDMKQETYEAMWKEAVQYNRDLLNRSNGFSLTADLRKRYDENLNLTAGGVMGYLEIPSLNVTLPVSHGTSDGVLQKGIGHLEWSSLPVGGESTHCVVSGHRGLPSAKLFTDLDKLREGDTFTLFILNEKLTYQVDQIRTVKPNEVDELRITEGKDYCKLLTCTPYGINTHRLLVRGHRIENAAEELNVISEAVVVDPLVVAPIVAFPLLFILVMMVLLKKPEKKIPKRIPIEEENQ